MNWKRTANTIKCPPHDEPRPGYGRKRPSQTVAEKISTSIVGPQEMSDLRQQGSFEQMLTPETKIVNYDPHGSMRYITDLRIMALSIIPRRVIDVLSEQRASFKG